MYLGVFETPEACAAWKVEYDLPFPVLPDEGGALFKRLTSGWVPWSVLVGSDGRVAFSENEFDEEGFSTAIAQVIESTRAPVDDRKPTVEARLRARAGPGTVLVLGGGIGGLVAARRLRSRLSTEHRIVVVDRSPNHLLQSSLLWLMEGKRSASRIQKPLARLRSRGIDFVNEEVVEIDLDRRRVATPESSLPFDYLVVALGARTAPESLHGFSEMAHDLYSVEGCRAIRDELGRFDAGKLGVLVTSMPFKCPAAPYEAAFLLESRLRRRGVRNRTEVHLYTPEDQPMPIAETGVGEAIVDLLRARGIHYHPLFTFEGMRPETSEIVDAEGNAARVDLLVAVPPHQPPEVVRSAGLTGVSGWIHVNAKTLSTGHPGVYAIGDVTSIRLPSGKMLPKAGVFAHHEAEVVADRIAAEIRGETPRAHFRGDGACWVELGGGKAAFASGNFYRGPEPSLRMAGPSRLRHWAKVAFEKWWLWRWL